MDQKLYEKIGKQEMLIEALKNQLNEVSNLMAKFIAGEERPEDWEVTPQGQLTKKAAGPMPAAPELPKRGRKSGK